MPRYQITAPDGKAWEVNAPEGATQDQVLEYAKSQWSKSQPEAAQPQPRKPLVDDPGFFNSLLIGTGRTFDRVGKGMEQLYYAGRSALSGPDTTSLVTGGKNQWDLKLDQLKQEAAIDDGVYKPLQEARPWATGIGEALPSLVIPGGGGTTLGANMLRMAVAGAAPGALEYGSTKERLGRAAVGATAGASVPLAGAALKTGKAFIEPLYEKGRDAIAGRVLNRVAGDEAPMVAQRMAQAAELVPGSAPTAAQVAENGGIAALERAAAQANPSAYAERAMQQSSARLDALRGIAGDDAAMKAAEAARQAAKEGFYKAADSGVAPIDSGFTSLLQRPQFAQAVQKAQELARNSGLDDIFFRGPNGQPVALLGQGGHYIKKALDEAGEYGSSSYTGKTSAKAASSTNDLFQAWLDQKIPEYALGKEAFAAGSKPINQMQLGQALLEKARPALADYGALGRETGATFANAMRNGDALAAKATGFGGATMRNVLTPEQMATVEGIAKDLARKANAQDLGRGVGSDTFQKLAMSNIAEQSGMPRFMGGLLNLPGVGRATRWAYEDADRQMQGLLADALLDPKTGAKLMSKSARGLLADDPIARQLLEQTVLRAGLLGAPAAYGVTN